MSNNAALSSLKTNHCLEVEVIEGKDIKPTNFFTSTASDPFCELNLRDQIIKTTRIEKSTSTPQWKETIQFELPENPEEETLFLQMWGKRMLGRNTFIGRIEIPVTLVLFRDETCKDSVKFHEDKRVERWFRLLPRPECIKQHAEFTAWVKLGFRYKFVPFVPSREQQAPVGVVPNAKIAYQCPSCSSFYSTEEIQLHMNSCSHKPSNQQQQVNQPPPQYQPPAQQQYSNQSQQQYSSQQYSSQNQYDDQQYSNNNQYSNHNQQYSSQNYHDSSEHGYSHPIQVSNSNIGDPSVPGGFSPDRSQPAPNSPSSYGSHGGNSFSDTPASVQNGFVPVNYNNYQNHSNPSEQNDLYSAPSYDFSNPF